jgi:hypothetical protein
MPLAFTTKTPLERILLQPNWSGLPLDQRLNDLAGALGHLEPVSSRPRTFKTFDCDRDMRGESDPNVGDRRSVPFGSSSSPIYLRRLMAHGVAVLCGLIACR